MWQEREREKTDGKAAEKMGGKDEADSPDNVWFLESLHSILSLH